MHDEYAYRISQALIRQVCVQHYNTAHSMNFCNPLKELNDVKIVKQHAATDLETSVLLKVDGIYVMICIITKVLNASSALNSKLIAFNVCLIYESIFIPKISLNTSSSQVLDYRSSFVS